MLMRETLAGQLALAHASALAQFLRARRSLVQPADVGLPAGGRRRVAGLRREEVAVLANISTDYYLRLEQGREDHPSDQVLDAIGRALRLDDDAVAYMRNLMRHQSVTVVLSRCSSCIPRSEPCSIAGRWRRRTWLTPA